MAVRHPGAPRSYLRTLTATSTCVLYTAFEIRPVQISIWQIRLGLISRRSRYRAGTRYFRRGVDSDGHVANFNETEQILLVGGDESGTQLSFVQIRGSIPVYWAEVNTLRYKPDVQVMELQDTVGATGSCLLVNNDTESIHRSTRCAHICRRTSTCMADRLSSTW